MGRSYTPRNRNPFAWRLSGACGILLALWAFYAAMAQTPPTPVVSGEEPSSSAAKPGKAVVIICSEMVDEGLLESIKRRVNLAIAEGATHVIFQMDTFGGRLDSAIAIWNYIMYDIPETVRTAAYIPTKAISAGALISVACDDIFMKKSTVIGDCAPISMGGKLEGVEREKAESPTRTYFETAAKANGYPAALCKAMVSIGIEVYQIKNKTTGQFEYFEGSELPGDSEKYDLDSKKLIDSKDQLVTLDAEKAVEYGLSRAVVEDLEGALQFLEARDNLIFSRPVATLETNWSEQMVRWITSPTVAGILLGIAMLGIYAELNSPGTIVPGAIAVAALALLFGSKYFIGLANWWEIALFFVGLALLMLELFVIPGFGITGISGILLILFSLAAMMVGNAPDRLPIPATEPDWELFWQNVYAAVGGFVAFLIVAAILSKYWHRIPVANRLILATPTPVESKRLESFIEAADPSICVGQRGVTLCSLRPAGIARIDGKRVDVVTQGELIDSNRPVRVMEVEGNRIVVKEVEQG